MLIEGRELKSTESTIRAALMETSGLGGVCHYCYNLCESLVDESTEVFHITNRNYELEQFPRSFELLPIIDSSDSYFGKWHAVFRSLKEHDINVFHIQGLITARRDFSLFPFMKLKPFKTVYTAHNVMPHDEEERTAKGMKTAFRLIYRLSDGLIVHSEKDREDLEREFGIGPGRIEVIPHGHYDFLKTPPSGSSVSIRNRLGLGGVERVILFFGAIRRYKGIHNLIKAFANLPDISSGTGLLIAGGSKDPAYFAELENLIESSGLSDSVVLNGSYIPFDEVADYFEAADVIALPYEHIYDSGVLRLAFSFSRPVLATDVGIFSELIQDGVNGFLVENSLDGVTGGLRRCITADMEDLKAMGVHSATAYREIHEWGQIADSTRCLYRGLLA